MWISLLYHSCWVFLYLTDMYLCWDCGWKAVFAIFNLSFFHFFVSFFSPLFNFFILFIMFIIIVEIFLFAVCFLISSQSNLKRSSGHCTNETTNGRAHLFHFCSFLILSSLISCFGYFFFYLLFIFISLVVVVASLSFLLLLKSVNEKRVTHFYYY